MRFKGTLLEFFLCKHRISNRFRYTLSRVRTNARLYENWNTKIVYVVSEHKNSIYVVSEHKNSIYVVSERVNHVFSINKTGG